MTTPTTFDPTIDPRTLSAVALNLEMGFRMAELSNALHAAGVKAETLSAFRRLFALCKEAGTRSLVLASTTKPEVPPP